MTDLFELKRFLIKTYLRKQRLWYGQGKTRKEIAKHDPETAQHGTER